MKKFLLSVALGLGITAAAPVAFADEVSHTTRIRAPEPDEQFLVAQKRVTGKRGSVTLDVAKGGLMFDDLTLAVEGSDLRVTRVVVTYRNGKKQTIDVDHDYRGRDRQRSIQIDGKRPIKSITISYAGRGNGRSAKFLVYGQQSDLNDGGRDREDRQDRDRGRDRDRDRDDRDDGRRY